MITSSHIIVIGYLHLADRGALKGIPRPGERVFENRGVFSLRSPARPNPIGYTVVKLLDVKHGEVIVEGLDFIEGTPIIDIKPYSPGWDSIHFATRAKRFPLHTLDPNKCLDLLIRDVKNFSGNLDQEGLAVVAMVFLLVTQYRIDPRDFKLGMEINRYGTALDALIGVCGATFGSGRIKVLDCPERVLTCRFYRGDYNLIMKTKKGKKISGDLTPEGAKTLTHFRQLLIILKIQFQ